MVESRPIIVLSAAMSIDGKIATRTGDSGLSSKKDKIRVHKIRSKVDAILIGINTVKRDDPLLNVRYTKGKNPIRIILDSHAQISRRSRIIKTCKKIPTIIVVSKHASKKNIEKLKENSLEIIITGQSKVDIKSLLKILYKKKIKKILLEGGGTINWEFLKNNLIDSVIVTIEPYLVGGKNAISLVEGEGFSKISNSMKLNLNKIQRIDKELVLFYGKIF